jgi:hypothetical protein
VRRSRKQRMIENGEWMMENGWWGIYGVGRCHGALFVFVGCFFGENFTGLEGGRQDKKRIINDLVWMNGFTQFYPRSEREIK